MVKFLLARDRLRVKLYVILTKPSLHVEQFLTRQPVNRQYDVSLDSERHRKRKNPGLYTVKLRFPASSGNTATFQGYPTSI